ncbi:MAG: aquaporin [bacterium]|nr:aquaporin [bacterium]
MRKYIGEFIGTFGLSLVVLTVIASSNSALTPFFAALTLMLFVYTVGHISGTHINPAVTLGLLSWKKISQSQAISYIIAQFLGAMFARIVAANLIPDLSKALLPLGARLTNAGSVGIAEMLGMMFFTFGIGTVVLGKISKGATGLVVGGSLLIGLFIAGTGSNGILNPAVALALGSFNLMYVLGPVIGAYLGFKLVNYLNPAEIKKKK